MAAVLTRLERPPAARLGWVLGLMFVLPATLSGVASGLVRVFGDAPPLEAMFQASDAVFGACAAFAAVYAAALMVVMNRIRRVLPLPAGRKPGRGDVTVGSIWIMGLVMWVLTTVCGALFLGGAINRVVGQVTTESGRISSKRVRQGKGCHRQIGVISATVPDGENLCVPPAEWDRLQVGDRLPVVSIVSRLGREVGLAPGALSRVTRSAP